MNEFDKLCRRVEFDSMCDTLDAAVFSGDSLQDREILNGFKEYLESWVAEVAAVEKHLDEIDEEEAKKK